jgi:glycosyltransferase involved in cell wall biosynthesis
MENTHIKISVIVPCYNVESFIDQCIGSLVRQTIGLECLEFIFVDDASTDGTLQKLQQWEKKYPEQILLIPCAKNRRQGAARNVGMQYASGEYIGFVDADDYISPEMYQRLYDIARKEQCDMVTCLFVREDREGRQLMDLDLSDCADQKIDLSRVEERKKNHAKRNSGRDCFQNLPPGYPAAEKPVFPRGDHIRR